jgi:hypothetical protein
MVADVRPGPEGGSGWELTNVNGLLFFLGGDNVTLGELWALDTREIPIPTVSPWGLVVLALLLSGAGLYVMRRRHFCRRRL